MKQIGKYIILKKAEYPAWEKANKLARCLSFNDIEEILAGRKHIHRNPGKRKVEVMLNSEEMPPLHEVDAGLYPTAGE